FHETRAWPADTARRIFPLQRVGIDPPLAEDRDLGIGSEAILAAEKPRHGTLACPSCHLELGFFRLGIRTAEVPQDPLRTGSQHFSPQTSRLRSFITPRQVSCSPNSSWNEQEIVHVSLEPTGWDDPSTLAGPPGSSPGIRWYSP